MNFTNTAILILTIFGTVSCASAPEKRIDEKLSQTEAVSSRADLQKEARNLIANENGLSADQKNQLSLILTDVSGKIDSANQESLQLRSLLLKELLQPDYPIAEVNLIKKKLRKVDDTRLNAMFEGVDKANKVLGRKPVERKEFLRSFIELDHAGPTAE